MIDLYKEDDSVNPDGIPIEDDISEEDRQALQGIVFDESVAATEEETQEILTVLQGDEFSKKFNPYHDRLGRFASGSGLALTPTGQPELPGMGGFDLVDPNAFRQPQLMPKPHDAGSFTNPFNAVDINAINATIDVDTEARRAASEILGHKLTDLEIAKLGGNMPDTIITGEKSYYDERDGVMFRVEGEGIDSDIWHVRPKYDEDYGDEGLSEIYLDELFLRNMPKGTGTHMLLSMADEASELGVEDISLSAERRDYGEYPMNGYYTWARLGFDADLDTVDAASNLPEWARDEAGTMRELMAIPTTAEHPSGAAIWKEYGNNWHGEFDLDSDSKSMEILHEYAKTRNIKMMQRKDNNFNQDTKPDHYCELPWDDEDEEVMNGVWERLTAKWRAEHEQKFNANHDTHTGRFASGSGVASWPSSQAEYDHMVVDYQNSQDTGWGKLVTRDGHTLTSSDTVLTFSAVDKDVATLLTTQGFDPATKPTNLARENYEAGTYAEFAPGRGVSSGLYVGYNPNDVSGYGSHTLAVKVKVKDLEPSPEQLSLGSNNVPMTPEIAFLRNDAVITRVINPQDIRFIGEPRRIVSHGQEFQELKFNPYHDEHGRFASGRAVAGALMGAIQTQGGFTYQPETGESPKEGLALSIYPERSKIVDALKIKGTDLQSYIKNNVDILNDHSNFLGAWHDTDSGRVFLDISKIVNDEKTAKSLCEKYGQRAYFNLKTFKTVDVVPESEAHKTSGAYSMSEKKQKTKVNLVHVPTDASLKELEEIARKIRERQQKHNAQNPPKTR